MSYNSRRIADQELKNTYFTRGNTWNTRKNRTFALEKKKDKSKMKTEKDYIKQFENIGDSDVTIFEELTADPPENVQAESYVSLLCTAGRAYCKVEDKEVHIGKNDLLIGHPNVFVNNIMISPDFQCHGMTMSPTYFETIFFMAGNYWDIGQAICRNPVIHLEEETAENFLFNFALVKRKLAQTELEHHSLIMKHLLQTLLFEFYDYLAPHLQLQDSTYNYSSAQVLFKRFTQMLSHDCPKKREVKLYADALCITPKYLSAICKSQSGKTASEIINSITVNHIKNRLTSSDLTIKEIATEAGFDNLSFFGKYVRRELGMSPRQFRGQK